MTHKTIGRRLLGYTLALGTRVLGFAVIVMCWIGVGLVAHILWRLFMYGWSHA